MKAYIANSLLLFNYFLQRWARAYRDNHYHAAVDTNNGVEAQNKLLKYKYMPRRRNLTLSAIVALIIEDFLPEIHSKYMFQNYAMSADYRSYNEFVPLYLRGRPRTIILHCLGRKQRSQAFSESDITIMDASSGVFEVKSHSGKVHTVKFSDQLSQPSCTCKDWTRYHVPCKHFFAIFRFIPLWQWNSLPISYLQSEYLSQDTAVLVPMVTQDISSFPSSFDDPMGIPSTSEDHFEARDELPKHKVCINKYMYIVTNYVDT